jgi:hypothetical protein
MQYVGDVADDGDGCAATALAPLEHAAGELDDQPSHSGYAEDSYAEPFEEDSTFIEQPAAESSGQQLLQQEPTPAIHPTTGLHQALLEQLQHDSSIKLHQQQHHSSSSRSLQQQEQALFEPEQQMPRSACSSPASPHVLRQQQQLLELQQQWAEQEHARLQRIADSLHSSPTASQQQQDWQQQQQRGLGPPGAAGSADEADIATAAATSGDGLAAGGAAGGELGSPSSVFLPAGSLTSSLHFTQPPLHASSPTAAALRGSAVLRQGMVRSLSPPLSPTPAAAAAAVAAAAPAAARQSLSALQLRCQALEVSLEQQAQQAQAAAAALASAHAAHSVEQESMRQYYEVRVRSSGGGADQQASYTHFTMFCSLRSLLACTSTGICCCSCRLRLRCCVLHVAHHNSFTSTQCIPACLLALDITSHTCYAALQAQLSDRQAELQLLMQHLAAAAARTESAAATTADGGGSTVVIGAEESLAAASIEVHHPSPLTSQGVSSQGPHQQQQPQQQQQRSAIAAAQAAAVAAAPPGSSVASVAAGGRPLSPSLAAVAANAGLAGAAAASGMPGGGVLSASVSLTDVALLRRELAQAEGLLQAYQAENKAAARRIKVRERSCVWMRTVALSSNGRQRD